MRIDAFSQITQAYGVNVKPKTTAVNKITSTDKVEISSFAKELQSVRQMVNSAPDVREEKVADIKDKLAKGTYNVDSEIFADKMLDKFYGLL